MENRTINIAVVAEVAEALKELNEKVVFVGGAVVSLYTDDPAADEIRPTGDIDFTLNVLSLGDWSRLQDRLAELDFYPDPDGHSICSYKYKNIPVDIMSSKDGPLGPANTWYQIGFKDLQIAQAKDQNIRIFSAPCYLATKFEAFKNRGSDYRTSHDIEDIIYIIDNRTTIVEEVKSAEESIRHFIRSELQKIIDKGLLEELLLSHIHPLMISERLEIVKTKINLITQ